MSTNPIRIPYVGTKEAAEYVKKHIHNQPKERIYCKHGLRELYKYYKENTIKDLQLSYQEYRAVLEDLNTAIVDALIAGEEIKLPANMGRLRVYKHKMTFASTNRLRVDWKRTREAGALVYHLNEHRDGHRYSFHWDRGSIRGPHVMPYSFIMSRENKRRLAKVLQENLDMDYSYKPRIRKSPSHDR